MSKNVGRKRAAIKSPPTPLHARAAAAAVVLLDYAAKLEPLGDNASQFAPDNVRRLRGVEAVLAATAELGGAKECEVGIIYFFVVWQCSRIHTSKLQQFEDFIL